MFDLILIAAGAAAVANRAAPDPDCRPQMILSSVAGGTRDATPPQQQRQKARPRPQERTTKPCMILASA